VYNVYSWADETMASAKILARGIHYYPIFFFVPNPRLYIIKNMCAYISDCVEAVNELPLLPNNTALEWNIFTPTGSDANG